MSRHRPSCQLHSAFILHAQHTPRSSLRQMHSLLLLLFALCISVAPTPKRLLCCPHSSPPHETQKAVANTRLGVALRRRCLPPAAAATPTRRLPLAARRTPSAPAPLARSLRQRVAHVHSRRVAIRRLRLPIRLRLGRLWRRGLTVRLRAARSLAVRRGRLLLLRWRRLLCWLGRRPVRLRLRSRSVLPWRPLRPSRRAPRRPGGDVRSSALPFGSLFNSRPAHSAACCFHPYPCP